MCDDRQVTNAVWSKRIHEIKVRETIDRLLLLQDLLSQKKILKEIFQLENFYTKLPIIEISISPASLR
jgi:hypothetical protein